jgi:hypothetical protein
VTGQGLETGRGDWMKIQRLIEVTGKGLKAGRGDWVKA